MKQFYEHDQTLRKTRYNTTFCYIHFFLKFNVAFIFRCNENMFCFNLNLDNNTSASCGTQMYSFVRYDIRKIGENVFIYTRQHHNEMPLTRVSKCVTAVSHLVSITLEVAFKCIPTMYRKILTIVLCKLKTIVRTMQATMCYAQ